LIIGHELASLNQSFAKLIRILKAVIRIDFQGALDGLSQFASRFWGQLADGGKIGFIGHARKAVFRDDPGQSGI
jgi:hypothetical protein